MAATDGLRKPDQRSRPSIIGRTILVGFGLATAFGIYLGVQFGWVVGILAGWMAGNALALALAYAWFRVDRSRRARAERDEYEDSSGDSDQAM
ncbi:MAG TPA: hypothetical protein VK090_00650 [Paracoccaceae bacterium]|nr:hypothetical protein [Paracoccaceae bacterium]